MNSILVTESDIRYGGSVAFVTTVETFRKGYVYITVVGSQDGHVVYQWSSRDLGFTFPLIDQAGQGLEWDGEPAEFVAVLIHRIDKPHDSVITQLAQTAFAVTS